MFYYPGGSRTAGSDLRHAVPSLISVGLLMRSNASEGATVKRLLGRLLLNITSIFFENVMAPKDRLAGGWTNAGIMFSLFGMSFGYKGFASVDWFYLPILNK